MSPAANAKKRVSLGQGLVMRGGVLQKRRQLPADVQAVLGRESVTSLRTADVNDARAVAKAIDEEIDLAIETIRAAGHGMSDEDALKAREGLREALDAHVESRLREDRLVRLRSGGVIEDDEGIFTEDLEENVWRIESRSPAEELATMLKLLRKSGVNLQGASVTELQGLAELFRSGQGRAEMFVWEDRQEEQRHGLFGSNRRPAPGPGVVAGNKSQHVDSRPLLEAINAYIDEKCTSIAGQQPDWKPGSATAERSKHLRDFAREIGVERLCSEIGPDELIEWRKTIQNMNRFRHAQSFFRWAARRGWTTASPFDRVPNPRRRKSVITKPQFNEEELHLIFSQELATSVQHPLQRHQRYAWHFWAPLLQLCHGLRGGEALGLRVADFKQYGDLLAMEITTKNDPTGLRRLKTAASERLLVVHPELIQRGFGDFLNGLDAKGWLFPEYVDSDSFRRAAEAFRADPDTNLEAKWTNAYSTWFDNYRKRVGVTRKKLSTHRFRDLWRDRATACGLDQLQVEKLGGWTPTSMAGSYGRSVASDVQEVGKLIAKVEFGGILKGLPGFPAR